MTGSAWTAGFARPWITWDGWEGVGRDAGTVIVDGLPVPVTATQCDVAPRGSGRTPEQEVRIVHEPGHDHCYTVMGDTAWTRAHGCVGEVNVPPGFSFGFHLENGLVAMALVDDHDSYVILATDWRGDGEVDLRESAGETYAQICGRDCCRDPETGVRRSTSHIGTMLNFESRDELLAILDRLSRLEVREERRVRPAPARPKRERGPRRYGTITLEEWRRLNGESG